MATELLLLHPADAPAGAVVAQPVRLRDRLAARVRAFRLDTELASGAEPDERVDLSLRAQALTTPATREILSRELHEVVRDAAPRAGTRALQAPTRRRDVLELAPQFHALAVRLLRPGPVDARGVAQVRLLLTDGRGPLYSRGAGDLRDALTRARQDLDA